MLALNVYVNLRKLQKNILEHIVTTLPSVGKCKPLAAQAAAAAALLRISGNGLRTKLVFTVFNVVLACCKQCINAFFCFDSQGKISLYRTIHTYSALAKQLQVLLCYRFFMDGQT